MSEREMLRHIMEELRLIRGRLDEHIDDQNTRDRCYQRDVSKIREEMAGHKVRLSGISAGIAIVVTATIHWIFGGWK